MLGDCDEIWHAGDIGDLRVSDGLRAWAEETGISLRAAMIDLLAENIWPR